MAFLTGKHRFKEHKDFFDLDALNSSYSFERSITSSNCTFIEFAGIYE
jgi:hypothetical protein